MMDQYKVLKDFFPFEGYEVISTRYANSILLSEFPEAYDDLISILKDFSIKESQIIEGGGSKSSIVKLLERKSYSRNWQKINIESEHKSNGKVTTADSHEIDHYKTFEAGNVTLEIEWNNKDPFFDRDLESFRKLHQHSEIALGIIITRGSSLQEELFQIYNRFISKLDPFDPLKLFSLISVGPSYSKEIIDFFKLPKEEAIGKIATKLWSSKYGMSTTHMDKLLVRLNRGVGNPCPIIAIGIGKERIEKDMI